MRNHPGGRWGGSFVIVATLTVAVCGLLLSADQDPSSRSSFNTATSAVVIDVVVRDRKGSPVTDLRTPDFELLEDGVRQDIGDMTLVGGTPAPRAGDRDAPSAASSPPKTSSTPERGPSSSVVAIVFDRLSPEARALAHGGALSYLSTTHEGEFAGVFLVDQALHTVQTYTTDKTAVRRGIDDAATRATAKFDPNNDKVLVGLLGDRSPATSLTASAEERGPVTSATATNPGGVMKSLDAAEGIMVDMVDRMERSYEAMMRDEQGYATTNALLALVDSLSLLPGRKTVVMFAEGLAIPPAVQARFGSVVGAANRANVSVYTIDAAGLRVHSGQMQTANTITGIGNTALGRDPEGGGKLLDSLEFNEDTLRKDPSVSLQLLAKQTGGFLINNTNDLASGFQVIDADRRFHYLLTYVPKNATYDGTWRTVSVRVPGRKVEIRARSGYFAVRQPGILPLLAYEAPALAVFDRVPPPRDIPVRVGAFTFPAAGGDSVVALLVDLEAQHVAFDVTDQGYRTDFTVLAQLRDANGEVVRKGSFHYRLRGTPDQLDAARAGRVLFYRQPTVPPGRYSIEVAVLDSFGMRATAERVPIEVPGAAGSEDPDVGSLIVVQSTERTATTEPRDNALVVGDVLAYPNLGDPVSLRAGPLSLLFSMKARPGEDTSVQLEVLQDDVAVAAGPVDLRAPGEDGQIRQFVSVPAATLLAGECLVRLTVSHGDRRTVRTATVRLVE